MPAATLYTGLDLHKRTVFALTVDADGDEFARERLPARADAVALYSAALPAEPGGQHRAATEATVGWYWVDERVHP